MQREEPYLGLTCISKRVKARDWSSDVCSSDLDGGPHKRWSMWLNSMQREEPYLALTCISKPVKAGDCSNTEFAQVLHGCRQLVS